MDLQESRDKKPGKKGGRLRRQDSNQRAQSMWLIGGGQFGKKAVQRLLRENPMIDITVVEKDPLQCRFFTGLSVACHNQDAVLFLTENLFQEDVPDWIIPMVPFHLAFEWIKQALSPELHFVPLSVSEEIMRQFPNASRGVTGRFYTSLADFICPDDCPALDHVCTIRKKPRPYFLYEKIKTENVSGFHTIVIQSHQILPGIGGYRPAELYKAYHDIKNSREPILLSTACKCHGVVDIFKTYSY